MTTEPELLSAVLAQPDEDGPRLAYATWCAAQPNASIKARGEVIKGRIRLRRAGGSMPHEESYILNSTLNDIEAAHGFTWDRPLAALVKGMEYERGFVELVTLTAADFLTYPEKLFALAPIRHLNLTDVRPVAEPLFESPHVARLLSLSLEGCGLTDEHMMFLANSPNVGNLRWLSLAKNKLTLDGIDRLARSPNLKKLGYASFLGNPDDPGSRYSVDGDTVVSVWLPPDGKLLEQRHGHLPWLHHVGPTPADLVPERLTLRA